MIRGCIFILLIISLSLSYTIVNGNDITALLPKGAHIIEHRYTQATGNDTGSELCVIYEFYGHFYFAVFEYNEGEYFPYFLEELGKPNPRSRGRVTSPYPGYSYRHLYIEDLNRDGRQEITLLFWPESSSQKELSIWSKTAKTFTPLLKLSADYDFRMYQTQKAGQYFCIEVVNLLKKNKEKFCVVQKWFWNDKKNLWEIFEGTKALPEIDYLEASRMRYEIDSYILAKPGEAKIRPILSYHEIPLDSAGLKKLLPPDSTLVKSDISPSFDVDTDPEILLIYSKTEGTQTVLKSLLLDWDMDKKKFTARPFPYESFGYPTDPDGNRYLPFYLINKWFDIECIATLSNIQPEGRFLALDIIDNRNLSFVKRKNYLANHNIHLFQYEYPDKKVWEIFAVFQDENANCLVRKYRGECNASRPALPDDFKIIDTQTLSPKNYRRRFYRPEGSYFSGGARFTNVLQTEQIKVNLRKDPLPNPEMAGTIEDYILNYLNALQIQKWIVRDIDNDNMVEGLLLIRQANNPAGPFDLFDLVILGTGKEGKREHYFLNETPFMLDEKEPSDLSGIYQYDFNHDNRNELLVCSISMENNTKYYEFTIYCSIMDRFRKIYTQMPVSSFIIYTSKFNEIKLACYKQEKSASINVYIYEWKDNSFKLSKVEKADNFKKWTEKIRDLKEPVLCKKNKLLSEP